MIFVVNLEVNFNEDFCSENFFVHELFFNKMILQCVKNIYTKRFCSNSKIKKCMYVLGDVSSLTSRR